MDAVGGDQHVAPAPCAPSAKLRGDAGGILREARRSRVPAWTAPAPSRASRRPPAAASAAGRDGWSIAASGSRRRGRAARARCLAEAVGVDEFLRGDAGRGQRLAEAQLGQLAHRMRLQVDADAERPDLARRSRSTCASMPAACSASAVVSPPMPPPMMIARMRLSPPGAASRPASAHRAEESATAWRCGPSAPRHTRRLREGAGVTIGESLGAQDVDALAGEADRRHQPVPQPPAIAVMADAGGCVFGSREARGRRASARPSGRPAAGDAPSSRNCASRPSRAAPCRRGCRRSPARPLPRVKS